MNFYVFFGESTGIDLGSVNEMIEHADRPDSGIAPELIAETRRELRRAEDMFHSDRTVSTEICRIAYLSARSLRFALLNRPAVEHKRKLHARAGQSRNPNLDTWIAKQIRDRPTVKPGKLYRDAPQWVKDDVGLERFRKRLAATRKAVATK